MQIMQIIKQCQHIKGTMLHAAQLIILIQIHLLANAGAYMFTISLATTQQDVAAKRKFLAQNVAAVW